MAKGSKKKNKPFMADITPHIEFHAGEEDPVSELVRRELEGLVSAPTPAETPGDLPVPAKATRVANVAERVVHTKTLEYMGHLDGCTCPQCLNDAVALALNALPPQYVVATKHEFLLRIAEYEEKFRHQIADAVTQACLLVLDEPRH